MIRHGALPVEHCHAHVLRNCGLFSSAVTVNEAICHSKIRGLQSVAGYTLKHLQALPEQASMCSLNLTNDAARQRWICSERTLQEQTCLFHIIQFAKHIHSQGA